MTVDEWVRANRERSNEIKRKYVKNNPERVKASKRKWAEANKKKILAKTIRYRADKMQARPKWLTKEQLKQIVDIYVNCPEGYEVDHIIPLRGKLVRGLHVPWNLQYLPISVNRRKSNKLAA